MVQDDLTPPEADELDEALEAAHAVMRSVPGAGIVSELLGVVIGSPLQRRQQAWQNAVAGAIRELRDRHGMSLESLQTNDDFIDIVMSASAAAVKTSKAEKLEALRNALVNSALPGAPEHAIQQMFINAIDRFTEWHIRILAVFRCPPVVKPDTEVIPNYMEILTAKYPELRDKHELVGLIHGELSTAGFLGARPRPTLETRMCATPRGEQLLAFISSRAQQ